jgi:hypothetical protein
MAYSIEIVVYLIALLTADSYEKLRITLTRSDCPAATVSGATFVAVNGRVVVETPTGKAPVFPAAQVLGLTPTGI